MKADIQTEPQEDLQLHQRTRTAKHLYIKSFQLYIKLKTQSCTTILSTALYMAAIAH